MTSSFRIPAPLQNTLDNLSFLGRTEEGEKIFFKEKVHLRNSDWGVRFRRYYYNENIETQKRLIKEIVENGLDSINTYKDNIHFNKLVEEFKKAKDGIYNLRNTYFKQLKEIGELDTLIYTMEQQLNNLDEYIK